MDIDSFESNLKTDMEDHRLSLCLNVETMREKQSEFIELMSVSDKSTRSAALMGAVTVGALGSAIAPGVGTVIGGVTGGVAGAALGFVKSRVAPSIPPALLKKELDNYVATLERAKMEYAKAKDLLDE